MLALDERFSPFTEMFTKVRNNYKELGIQEAEEQTINIIKKALNRHGNTELRFVNMFGTEFYDPDFILLGVPPGAHAKIRNNVLEQDRFKTSMNTLDKVNELKDLFDVNTDLDLFVLKDSEIHQVPVDSSTNLAEWLQNNNFNIDDKIIVLPDFKPSVGQPMFEDINWKLGEFPSPNYPIFQTFTTDLITSLNRMGIINTYDIDILSKTILSDIPSIIRTNGYSLSYILSELKEGREFLNFDEKTLDRWLIVIKNKILEKKNPRTRVEVKTIQDIFEDLHRRTGTSFPNAYYRQAKSVTEEIILILLQEGVFNSDPPLSKVSEYLGFNFHGFLNSLRRGLQISPHKPEVILRLKDSISKALSDDTSLTSKDVDRINKKIEDSLNLYSNVIEKYLDAEGVWNSEDGIFYRVKNGPRKRLIGNIFHSDEILEQIFMKSKLSRLLFASPDYLTSHFLDKNDVDKRPKPDRLERMCYLVSRWDSTLFESIDIKVSEYQVEVMKRKVLAEIQKWMFTNPRADYSPRFRLKWKPYISENFVKWGRTYTKEDLKPHYDLVSSITTALAVRAYKDTSTFTRETLDYSTKTIQREMGVHQGFFASLGKGGFYSQKILENIFIKFAEWHRNEYGDRISGIDYDRKDSYERLRLSHYQEVLYKIQNYAEARSITLFDGKYSTGLVTIKNHQYKISDILRKDYDKTFIKQQYKEFHLIFQLSKYLGFDPLTFSPLEDTDMATGRYVLHHFLAEMFRKMSSNVADIVLTSQDLHMTYEAILRGKEEDGRIYIRAREGEAFIRGLMKSIQDLILYKSPTIKTEQIKKVLINNLGTDKGMEIYYKWTGNKDFKNNLIEFNKRRIYAQKSDYNSFLKDFYEETWKNRNLDAYRFISKQNKYSIFFSYKKDFDMLYRIFPWFKKQTTLV